MKLPEHSSDSELPLPSAAEGDGRPSLLHKRERNPLPLRPETVLINVPGPHTESQAMFTFRVASKTFHTGLAQEFDTPSGETETSVSFRRGMQLSWLTQENIVITPSSQLSRF